MGAIAIAIQVVAALLFAQAAWTKLADRAGFEAMVSAWRIAPTWAEAPIAWVLPPVELVLAAMLLLPFAQPVSAVAAAGLLTVFAASMAINLMRGRRHIECGCGRPGQTIGWGHAARNLALAALLVAVQALPAPASLGEAAVGLAGGVVLFVLDYVLSLIAAPRARQGVAA